MIHPDVFKDFGITVNKCYKVRGAYICETNKGIKAIRKSDYTPEQITLQYDIKEHLIERGFNCVDQLYLNQKSTPYTIYYNRIFVMSDWYNGQEIDFFNPEDIYQSIKLLGEMHIAVTGFNAIGTDIKEVKIKNLGEVYKKRYAETIKLKKRISNRGNKTEFEVLYFQNASEYMELQEMALEFLNPDNYEQLIKLARQERTLAHHKYTYHNLKKTSDNSIILSGLEKSGYDVQLTDVAYVIRRIMEKNEWNVELLFNIMNEYSKIRPLSLQEWDIIKGMIIFPERFAKLCNKYFYTKRRWNYNMFYRKLSNMLVYKEVQVDCAKEILKW